MTLTQITYFLDGKPQKLKVKLCKSLWNKFSGLMFCRQSSPLLFIFKKNKKLSIHSLFCKPFTAIWLDDKMKPTKIIDVKKWKLNLSGHGKYLLEIPIR